MSYATIDALRESLARPAHSPDKSAAYAAKMLHDLPDGDTVDRVQFILERCKGKVVLEFGASGPLHRAIVKVARVAYGVDVAPEDDAVIAFDLDDVTITRLPEYAPDVIVCGEILEHLSNPGYFLARLRQYDAPVIISVPNAFAKLQARHLADGHENVNIDHVAWYSPRTLRTLLERSGYGIQAFHWYNGDPGTAEGLIVVARKVTDAAAVL